MWMLVPLPKENKTVGCRWVFSIKHKTDGSIERYKARLTFSLVAKLNIVRVLSSLVVNLDWSLHQFDVKNAFLHGDLEEELCMDIPSGFTTLLRTNVMCKL
ncbi:hypothetical protein AAG906_016316 [Vitis piasezkii]